MPDFDELSDKELWDLTADEDELIRAEAFANIANRLFGRGEFAEAVSPASAARELFHKLDRPELEGTSAYLEGCVFLANNRNLEALESLNRATELYRIYATEEMLADAVRKQAEALIAEEDFDNATEAYESAIRLYESNNRHTLAGICALDLGESQGRRGLQVQALQTFRESLRIFKAGGDYIGSGRSNDRIAAALIDLGDLEEAITHLRESLNIFDYINDELRVAYSQYRLGWTLVSSGENEEAIPLLREASFTYKKHEKFGNAANADTQLAHALSAIGDDEDAIGLYRKTRSFFDAAGDMSSAYIADVNAAAKISSQNPNEAIAIYRRVIAGAEEIDDQYLVRAAKVRMAETLCKLDESEHYQEAISLLETTSVDDWGQDLTQRSRHLNALAYTLIELGRDEEAEPLLTEVVSLGLESGFLAESAEANRMLALIESDRGNEQKSNELVAQAIALYLAAGEDETARGLSKRLLPSAVPTPQDILRAGSESLEE